MTKETEFTQQNSERAIQAASLVSIGRVNLQSKASIRAGFFSTACSKSPEKCPKSWRIKRRLFGEHSISLTAKTLSNTLDFGHKLTRLKEPQELAELQSEFVSRQSQAFSDHTKELSQKIKSGTEKMANLGSRGDSQTISGGRKSAEQPITAVLRGSGTRSWQKSAQQNERPRKTVDLAGRYREIGISAVVAALRCQEENRSALRQQKKNNSKQSTSGREMLGPVRHARKKSSFKEFGH